MNTLNTIGIDYPHEKNMLIPDLKRKNIQAEKMINFSHQNFPTLKTADNITLRLPLTDRRFM